MPSPPDQPPDKPGDPPLDSAPEGSDDIRAQETLGRPDAAPPSPRSHEGLVAWLSALDRAGDETVEETLPEGLSTPPGFIEELAALGRPPAPMELPERYEDLGPLARGGMGQIRRVRDTRLDQQLAMKIIRWDALRSRDVRRRFLTEARLTARLQHPSVVSVHDFGELPDGRLWFTMREVRGRTLGQLIHELHLCSQGGAWGSTPGGWTFRRLIGAFELVCRALAYAHSEGVVHRDLKPDNIMIGQFGEVQVMDWGLAKIMDWGTPAREYSPALELHDLDPDAEPPADERPHEGPGALSTHPMEDVHPLGTRQGRIMGTPAYMAPEQARGEVRRHSPATDVYALGATLYHLLAGRPPYRPAVLSVVEQVAEAPPPPLPQGLAQDHPALPEEIMEICRQAMARRPLDRPEATEVADRVRAWLDGVRKAEQARAVVEQALPRRARASSLRRKASALREEAAERLEPLSPVDPVEDKLPGWRLEDRAAALEAQALVERARFEQGMRSALNLAPELPEAHAQLAELFKERLLEAERRGDEASALAQEELLEAHDLAGQHRALLRGEGRISLRSEPPGAAVTLHRVVMKDRRLVPVRERALGVTPLKELPLPRGRWRLTLEAPGRAPVTLPLHLHRLEHFERRPHEGEPRPVRLPPMASLGPEDRLVPGGWFLAGGDEDALDGLPGRRVWADAFVMRQDPVRFSEYLAFLDALVDRGQEALALRLAPQRPGDSGSSGEAICRRGEGGRFTLDPAGPIRPEHPVTWVDHRCATAYAAWVAETTGLPWRLPHELEWEKAARGVDGRALPWGDHLDPTWACMAWSHRGRPSPAAPEDFPLDLSPYGVRGMVGNVRDWCANAYRKGADAEVAVTMEPPGDEDFVVIRGGAWASTAQYCRPASRFANRPDARLNAVGFRLARSLSDEE